MKRTVALALGAALALATGAAVVRAGEHDKDVQRIEKHVVIRHGGGAFLGVGLDDVEGEARGAKVRSVEPDSPAAKAGIKEADVVVRFDGEGVRSAAQLVRLVGETPAGRTVGIEVLRGGASQKLSATLGEGRHMRLLGEGPGEPGFHFELPTPPEPPDVSLDKPPSEWPGRHPGDRNLLYVRPHAPRRLGIELIDMGEQLAAAYKLAAKSGVLVSSVDAGGAAAKAGIKAGDVVLAFDGHEIGSGHALREAVGDVDAGKTVKVKVQRDGRPLELDVTLGRAEPKHELTPEM
jgi:serine protease Do